jgi:hypothetical protein
LDELIAHYGDITSNTFFSQLINLRKRCPITKNIQQFKKLCLRVKNIPKDNFLDLFMGTLKESIQHEVHLFVPKSLECAFILARKVEGKNMDTRRVATNNYGEHDAPSSNLTQPMRLKPQKIDERRANGLCFNCDRKYSKGHKYSENNYST